MAMNDVDDLAAEEFASVAQSRKDCFSVEQMQALGGLKNPKSRLVRYQKRCLGRVLVNQYQSSTGDHGPIDWAKFHAWCKEHMGEISLAGLVVKILTLIVLL